MLVKELKAVEPWRHIKNSGKISNIVELTKLSSLIARLWKEVA